MISVFYSLNGVIMLLMLFDVVRSVRKWDLDKDPEAEGIAH